MRTAMEELHGCEVGEEGWRRRRGVTFAGSTEWPNNLIVELSRRKETKREKPNRSCVAGFIRTIDLPSTVTRRQISGTTEGQWEANFWFHECHDSTGRRKCEGVLERLESGMGRPNVVRSVKRSELQGLFEGECVWRVSQRRKIFPKGRSMGIRNERRRKSRGSLPVEGYFWKRLVWCSNASGKKESLRIGKKETF